MESAFRGTCPDDLNVIETCLSATGTGIALWPFHRQRLERTCDRLGIPLDVTVVENAIADIPKDVGRRVRLTVDLQGEVSVSHPELAPMPEQWSLVWADETLMSDDPWRGVKTTNRGIYDRARAKMPEGTDEVLFLNERGDVAEGSITNVFVERGGVLLTPPLSSGALPGVLRASLLAEGRARECALRPDDLKDAPLFVGNALRGLVPAGLSFLDGTRD